MPSSDIRGRFVWYELLTTDVDAAVDFYAGVIGWGTEVFAGAGEPYTMWKVGDRPIGGIMKMPEEALEQGGRPHWLPYIATPDVDATVERARERGARVYVAPRDIPSVGRFAVLADPQGAIFAAFTPGSDESGRQGPPRRGEFSWHELATTDREAAFDFYSDLFGWEETDRMDMGEAGIYQMYGRVGSPLGGMFTKPAEVPGPATWLLYALVDDVNGAVERVKGAGGQVLNGPMEVPGGDWIAQCLDPQGAAFAVHHRGDAAE